MGILTLLKRTIASVPTPSNGKASLFIDSTSGLAQIKDDSGNVTAVGGAPSSRAISAGAGLTGGGDLSADRTIDVVAADSTITVTADAIKANVGTAAGTVAAGNDARITGAVPSTRTLTAGTGLTGGGDLSANRTLNVNVGTTAGTVAAGDDARITGAVQNSRTITAGVGLTGGGDLSANRTLNVNVGTTAGSVAAGDDARIVNAVPKTRTITASNGIQGGGDLSADRALVYNIPIGGLKTGANYVYTVADRHVRYERSNGGAAMADTMPALGLADAGWTLKVENRGTVPAEVIVFTTPNGSFQGGSTTYTLNYGCRQMFLWTGTGWVYDTGNANLTRLTPGIATAANDIPAFADSSGRVLKNSGFAAAAATAAVPGFMSAADKGRLDNQARGQVNVLDFGADPTGAADSLAAIQAAIAALPNGGIVFFPAGTYLISATLTVATAHIRLIGATRYDTTIKANFTTGDMVVAAQWYQTFEDLSFTGPGANAVTTKTNGFAINAGNAAGAYTAVRRCSFTYQYDAVNLSNSLAVLLDCEVRFFAHSAVVVNHNSDHQIEGLTCDNAAGALPSGAGIDVVNCASLLLSDCNVIHANNALNISPAAGVTIPSVKAVNCFFDTSVVGLNMTGAGSVFRCQFTNCWFSSMSSEGIHMNPAAGGTVNGVTFVNCDIYNNVAGNTVGVYAGANVGKWKMQSCSIAGWTTGMQFVAGANHFPTVMGNSIGAIAAFAGNTTGIVIGAGTYKGLVLIENDVIDNTTAYTLGALTITAATAGSHRIVNNTGINPHGAVTTPAIVSGTDFTNTTGFRVNVFLKSGATAPTGVAVNGVTIGLLLANQQTPLLLEPGGVIRVTYAITPTWVWVGQ